MSGHLLLVHGWGFGAGVWHPLKRLLPKTTIHTLNLGYFGPEQLQTPPPYPFIAVGHSLGFLWLAGQLSTPHFATHCQGLISINGFTRFAHAPDFPFGMAKRILTRMHSHLASDPISVLTAFQQQGGLTKPPALPNEINQSALQQGISWLVDWDYRHALSQWSRPILAIATQDDAIVTPAMTRALFAPETIHWLLTGGHVLPLTQPQACADQIKPFMSTLS